MASRELSPTTDAARSSGAASKHTPGPWVIRPSKVNPGLCVYSTAYGDDYGIGQAWDINDKTCADRPIATLRKGSHYIFVLRNMAQYLHPIHLHGLSFKVLDSDRKKIEPYFTDTYLLGKNETARIALVADNPGVWMFHCHVIDHMETGLMAAIEVV